MNMTNTDLYQITSQIVHRTPSEHECIICYDLSKNDIFYVSKGQYGGYLVKPPRDLSNILCFYVSKIEELKTSGIINFENEQVRSRLIETAQRLSLDPKYILYRRVKYTYIPASLEVKKQTDRYIVVEPRLQHDVTLEATAVHIFVSVLVSCSRKHCYEYAFYYNADKNDVDYEVCGVDTRELLEKGRFVLQIIGETYETTSTVGKRSQIREVRVKIVEDTFQLVEYIARRLGTQLASAPVTVAEPRAIPLKFFIVSYELPSEGRLNVRIDEIFRNVKIGEKIIKIVRGYFYNKLKTIRAEFYDILNKYTINVGYFRLLPTHQAGNFLNEINRIKKKLEEFERQLKEFLMYGKRPEGVSRFAVIDEEYTKMIMEYAKQHGIDIRSKIESISIVDGFYVKLVPVVLDLNMFAELDENLRNEIEKLRQETIERVRQQLEARARQVLEILIKRLEKLTVVDVREAKHEIDKLLETAREMNIEVPMLNKLSELLSETTPEKVRQLKLELASGRVKALLGLLE